MKITISRSRETFAFTVDGLRHSSSVNMKHVVIEQVVTLYDGRMYHSCFEERYMLTFVFTSHTEVANKNNCVFLG
jgi:hypothetical protein